MRKREYYTVVYEVTDKRKCEREFFQDTVSALEDERHRGGVAPVSISIGNLDEDIEELMTYLVYLERNGHKRVDELLRFEDWIQRHSLEMGEEICN